MPDPYRTEKIENWVGDFGQSPRAEPFPAVVREYAPGLLVALLQRACGERDVGPEEVEEKDLKAGLLEGVARLEVPGSVREHVPALAGAFLEDLEERGRLASGRALGKFVAALHGAYVAASSGKGTPIVNKASPLGRNDPCPCGSGKKYKKCCMQQGG